jgi:hypothetical protein
MDIAERVAFFRGALGFEGLIQGQINSIVFFHKKQENLCGFALLRETFSVAGIRVR